MDLLSMLFGRPARLTATFADFTQQACERSAKVRLLWTERFYADIDVNWGESRLDRFELEFEKARLVLDPLDGGSIQMWEDGSWIGVIELPAPANPHLALIRDFETAILSGLAPVCDLFDGLFVDKMLLAAETSHAVRRPVELASQDGSRPHTRADTHI
jgi:predicted dehydrogenase